MLYGIMLVYYEDYCVEAVERFEKFLKKIEPGYKLIVVSNNENICIPNKKCIPGNNINWEFSGWDEGIKQLEQISNADSFIFCNDTFCFNNPFGVTKEIIMSLVFKYCYYKNKKKNQLVISGSTHTFNEEFFVFDNKANIWVSTYLFLVSGTLLNHLERRLSLSEEQLNKVLEIKNNEDSIRWSGKVSGNLQVHINNWLFPPEGFGGWYKSRDVSNHIKERKAKAIVNEKYLTAYCLTNKGKYYEINPKKVVKNILNSFMRK
ncbi:hypothetical protein LGM22_07965 [Klebsiella quasipneumoniae subsp. quasipneumoniae]|uniref:Glycosyltransferase n=1 Tax=Klebsiella pneumoniae TaxID=573 RepID=A0A1C3SZD3_KLEPN|nr:MULTISPECIES: hypothetical protein [Klebsiella]EKW4784283.1 hypothetical protein [Klebsiella variicola]UDC72517.1 hypothetical protein LGM22_07965 [Klebsiella quasipneumoniae subsp. quasipneumoniae]WPI72078.1 hypothetical protein R8536_08415 [Klebsiella pneumoniae]SCA95947.1 Uncharacterised protein [Klebsiella pneumoniae]SLP34838.1 Uncharacterised protein [Klebsiella variicola]